MTLIAVLSATCFFSSFSISTSQAVLHTPYMKYLTFSQTAVLKISTPEKLGRIDHLMREAGSDAYEPMCPPLLGEVRKEKKGGAQLKIAF